MVQARFSYASIAMGVAMLTACSAGGANSSVSNVAMPPMSTSQSRSAQTVAAAGTTSVLGLLDDELTIGSAVDPVTGDVNPYGLDIAKVSSGKITAGDLVVCDFNDVQNVQGTGTAIIALHPFVGATPTHIIASEELTGCDALAMSPAGPIWAAVFSDNDNPIVSGGGSIISALDNPLWHNPFGEAFVPAIDANHAPAFYVSNAGDGSLVRIAILAGPTFKLTRIVTGFPVNHGVPGSILGPSGLNYQRNGDRLYVVDGTNNALYAIDHISNISANGIVVSGSTFSGAQGANGHVIFSGMPLNGPISSAVLFNGNIVLGNTLDPNGQNLMVEVSPAGTLLKVRNVDTGASGAIFGMVATGTTAATTKLYFNDDNDNTVKVLKE